MAINFRTCGCGDHAFAEASHWHVVLVSPEDVGLFSAAYSLTSNPSKRPRCVVTYWQKPKAYKKVHHLILGKKDGHCVDHANRDPTDNRRSNLRFATRSESAQNRKRMPSYLGIKGVYLGRIQGTYEAFIVANGERKWLGRYKSAVAAAEAYNKAAVALHGKFAAVNEDLASIDRD